MEQTMHLARTGWKQEETDRLWQEIRAAAETGAPLRGVFEKAGEALGRKPNSVRNYYYMQLREQAEVDLRRAAPFETFTEEEVHDLVRKILLARGQGQSVRACVMALAQGDRHKMLRYQNKYRSVLRKKPQLIEAITEELKREGLPIPKEPAEEAKQPPSIPGRDPDIQAVLAALASLSRRIPGPEEKDRKRVQEDLLLLQLEELKAAAGAVLSLCRDFLSAPEEGRQQRLPDFCASLAGCLSCLQAAAR